MHGGVAGFDQRVLEHLGPKRGDVSSIQKGADRLLERPLVTDQVDHDPLRKSADPHRRYAMCPDRERAVDLQRKRPNLSQFHVEG